MNKNELHKFEKQISSCALFKDMSEKELESLLSADDVKLIHRESGILLDSKFMYIVLAGSVIIEKQASDGRYVTMVSAASGAAVNAASVFLDNAAMSRIITQTGSSLLQISEPVIKNALLAGGIFALNMTRFLADRIGFLNKKITSLAGYTAGSRLHLYLQENNVDGKVEIPMSMTDFADFLGVGRASLYRTLEQLQTEGTIERKGRVIILKEKII